jgi:hypothetical protein
MTTEAAGATRPTLLSVEVNASRQWPAVAIGAFLLAMALVVLVAGIPDGPLSVNGPEGTGPLALYRWAASAIGLGHLSATEQSVLAVVAFALVSVTFVPVLLYARANRFALRTLLVLAIGLQGLVATLPLLLSDDVISYATYGRIAGVHEANPYVATPSDFPEDPLSGVAPRWSDQTARYGPAFTHLSAFLARVFPEPSTLVLAFKVLASGMGMLLVLLSVRIARRVAPQLGAFAVALVGLNPLVLLVVIGGGHNDLLVALPIVAALLLLVRTVDVSRAVTLQEILATCLLVLAATIKAVAFVPLLVHLAIVLGRRSGSVRLSAAVWHGIVALGSFIALAAPFLQAENPTLGTAGLLSVGTALAPAVFLGEALAALSSAVGITLPAGALGQSISIVFLVWCTWALVRLVRRSLGSEPRGGVAVQQARWWGSALFLVALGTTLVWPWYLAWSVPLAWLLPRREALAVVVASLAAPLAVAVLHQSSFTAGVRIGVPLWVVAPVLLLTLVPVARYLSGRWPERVVEAATPSLPDVVPAVLR